MTNSASAKAPFQKFFFSCTDRVNGRVMVSLDQTDDDAFELHVEKGPVGQLTCDFTRTVARKSAEVLRDALAEAGVFGWDEDYPDDADPGGRRWSLWIVFEEGVYAQQSGGGSSVPAGFDDLLEALYRLDLPRPGADDAPGLARSAGAAGTSGGGAGLAALFAGGPEGGPDASMLEEMQRTMAELQANPGQFQRQIKEEFATLPRDQQEQMLDMLAATGMATRDWWERFLRGY